MLKYLLFHLKYLPLLCLSDLQLQDKLDFKTNLDSKLVTKC